MNPAHAILQQLLDILMPVLAATLATLSIAVLRKLLKKLGLDVDEKQEARLRQVAEDAVRASEEFARREQVMSPEQKSGYAVDIVRRRAPEVPLSNALIAIDAALPKVRAEDRVRLPPTAR